MVEEREGDGPVVLNQPAGHVEEGEAPLDAVVREVAEETGLPFVATGFVGAYPLRSASGKDFLRLCFTGHVPPGVAPAPRDREILGCRWLTRKEIEALPRRSGLVLQCMDDAAALIAPLALVRPVRSER